MRQPPRQEYTIDPKRDTRKTENGAREARARMRAGRRQFEAPAIPARRATLPAQAPAALTTVRPATKPREVSTPVTPRACIAIPETAVSRSRRTPRSGKCLFGILGGRVRGKRVDDLLPLRGPGLLQHPEGPKRPGRAGVAQDLVQKELGLRGLEFPGLAAVLARQEAVVGGDPAAIGRVEADGRQPARNGSLLGFPGGAAIPGAEQLSGETRNPAVLRVREGDRAQRPLGAWNLDHLPFIAAVRCVQNGAGPSGRPAVLGVQEVQAFQ